MFQHLVLGGGYEYHASSQRVQDGLKQLQEHRKRGCECFPPTGDDVKFVMTTQARYMLEVEPESRA